MASRLEKQVREMDGDDAQPLKEVAADIAKKLGVNSGTVEMYLWPKRGGYGQLRDYNEFRNLANDSSYGGLGNRDSQRSFEGDIVVLPPREIRRITDRSSTIYGSHDLSGEESMERIREYLNDRNFGLTELQKEVLQRVIFGEKCSEIAKEKEVTRAAVSLVFNNAKRQLQEFNRLGLAS